MAMADAFPDRLNGSYDNLAKKHEAKSTRTVPTSEPRGSDAPPELAPTDRLAVARQ